MKTKVLTPELLAMKMQMADTAEILVREDIRKRVRKQISIIIGVIVFAIIPIGMLMIMNDDIIAIGGSGTDIRVIRTDVRWYHWMIPISILIAQIVIIIWKLCVIEGLYKWSQNLSTEIDNFADRQFQNFQ